MKRLVLILFILIIPFSIAGNFQYEINENEVFAKINFSTEDIDDFTLPAEKEIFYFIDDSYIEYSTHSFIEKNNNDYFFVISNDAHKNSSIKVILPPGAILDSKYFIFPKNYIMSTNGQNIIIIWENSLEKEILIPYTIPTKFNIWSIFIIFIIVLYIFIKKYKRKKLNYTKNLFGDEKRIMEYLSNQKECWTKEIVRELRISKVRLSRKLRGLEEKGMLKREPHGNENRIILIK